MDIDKIRQLLIELQAGKVSLERALDRLRSLPYEDLDFAKVDLHRSLRQGLPEVIYCPGKSPDQVISILGKLWHHHDRVMATRMSAGVAARVQEKFPEGSYDPTSRLFTLSRNSLPVQPAGTPYGLIVSAGSSDLPVAEEAVQTLEFLGSRAERIYDVGVAGLHRLLDQQALLFGADVIISVAGMEGALTSVVGGLVQCPVIGVPTRVGYGASFEGLAPLLAMLNSCAPGVAVVNIDNGFGAGLFAHLILRRIGERQTP